VWCKLWYEIRMSSLDHSPDIYEIAHVRPNASAIIRDEVGLLKLPVGLSAIRDAREGERGVAGRGVRDREGGVEPTAEVKLPALLSLPLRGLPCCGLLSIREWERGGGEYTSVLWRLLALGTTEGRVLAAFLRKDSRSWDILMAVGKPKVIASWTEIASTRSHNSVYACNVHAESISYSREIVILSMAVRDLHCSS